MALYKINIIEPLDFGSLQLAAGTVHYLNHSNKSLAIFENIYLKDALESKFDLSIPAEQLPLIRNNIRIEAIAEVTAQLLQFELKLLLQQKSKAIESSNFERAASLKDYEKELQTKIDCFSRLERSLLNLKN